MNVGAPKSIAPAGQVVLPTEPAQLGLDGAPYAPAEPEGEGPTDRSVPTPEPRGALALPFGEAAQRELAYYRQRPRPEEPGSARRAPPSSGGALLGHNTNNLAAPSQGSGSAHPMRTKMWRLREGLRGGSGLPLCLHTDANGKVSAYPSRVDRCGRVRIGGDVSVHVRQDEDGPRATLRGVLRCGSVWACPCCGLQIRTARASLVTELLTRHEAAGGGHLMLTLTFSHGAGDDPERVIRGVQAAFSRLRMRRGWRRIMASLGYVGDVKVLEMTYGAVNGWHPHVHGVLCTAWPVPEDVIAELAAALAHEWRQAVIFELGEKHAPDMIHGVDLRGLPAAKVAEYISKLGLELVDPGGKTARKQNRTPLQIAEGAAKGASGDLRLWQDYVAATQGLKFMTWSRGSKRWRELDLRRRYGLLDQDDQEIVEGEEQGAVEVARIAPALWDGGLRDHGLAIIELVELGGSEALERALVSARMAAA